MRKYGPPFILLSGPGLEAMPGVKPDTNAAEILDYLKSR